MNQWRRRPFARRDCLFYQWRQRLLARHFTNGVRCHLVVVNRNSAGTRGVFVNKNLPHHLRAHQQPARVFFVVLPEGQQRLIWALGVNTSPQCAPPIPLLVQALVIEAIPALLRHFDLISHGRTSHIVRLSSPIMKMRQAAMNEMAMALSMSWVLGSSSVVGVAAPDIKKPHHVCLCLRGGHGFD